MPPKRLGKHAPPPPDDRRCRRSDGKQWRCPEPALRGFALCVYHHRRSYQIPNEGETSPTQATLEEEEEKDKPKEEEQKPWKLRIKKPNQMNSPNPNPPNPNPPPSPSLSEATENENPNPNPNILPTVLALEHSKTEGRRRRGRKPKDNNNNNTPRKEESPLPLPKDLTNNNNENNNSNNNNNKISGGQRCKRSDGRGWQCKARSLLGEHYCEHHYHKIKNQQVKKQSHSKSGSKKRRRVSDASLILTKRRREPLTSPPLTSTTMSATRELPKGIMTISPSAGVEELGFGGGVRRKLGLGFEAVPISVRPLRSKNPQPVLVGPVKRLALGGGKGVVRRREKEREREKDKACHRCGEAEAGPVVRCKHCLKRYFCSKCIQLWYHGMSKLEINSMCPVCRNCCNCDICTRLNNININKNNNIINTDNFVDVPVEEVANGESKIINIKYASYPFSQLLPIIKKLSIEQLDELEIEAKKQGKRVTGTLVQVLEKGHDEKCNNCKGQIVDFSMNCSDCNYKLCLICSHKIRKEENLETSNFIINCRNKNSCKSNKSIFHTCDVRCPLVCEGNLGLVYSFPVGWSETLIIGQENNKNAETPIACKSNGHLNNEGFL